MTLVLASEEKAVGKTKTTFSFILLSFPLTAKLALCHCSRRHHRHRAAAPRRVTVPSTPPGYAARSRDAAQPPPHPRIRRHCSLRCRQWVTKAKGLEEKGKKKKTRTIHISYVVVLLYVVGIHIWIILYLCYSLLLFAWMVFFREASVSSCKAAIDVGRKQYRPKQLK